MGYMPWRRYLEVWTEDEDVIAGSQVAASLMSAIVGWACSDDGTWSIDDSAIAVLAADWKAQPSDIERAFDELVEDQLIELDQKDETGKRRGRVLLGSSALRTARRLVAKSVETQASPESTAL
jgi:hypothetical protein